MRHLGVPSQVDRSEEEFPGSQEGDDIVDHPLLHEECRMLPPYEDKILHPLQFGLRDPHRPIVISRDKGINAGTIPPPSRDDTKLTGGLGENLRKRVGKMLYLLPGNPEKPPVERQAIQYPRPFRSLIGRRNHDKPL